MFEMTKGSVWLSSLASGKPCARGEMRSRYLPQLSKQDVRILSQNLRGLKKTGEEAKIILRIKERRLFAAMFQETWKAGSEVWVNEGITFLEHGLPRCSKRPGKCWNEQARCASRSVRESWQHDSPS